MVTVTKVFAGKDDKVTIEWLNDGVEYSIKKGAPANAAFYKAIKSLSSDVIDICEMDCEEGLVKVRGVTLTTKNGEIIGAIISAQKALLTNAAPWCFNTPFKKIKSTETAITNAEPKNENGEILTVMPQDTAMKLDKIINAAKKYIADPPKQLDLAEEEAEQVEEFEEM